MKKVALFLALVLMLSAGFVAKTKSSKEADIRAITKLEEDQVKADLTGDVSFYEKNFTEDYTAGTSWGTWYTKQSLLADLHDTANNRVSSSKISNLKVRVYGDSAVATFNQAYEGMLLGERRVRKVINTEMFVRQNGRWIIVATHTSAEKTDK